LVLPARHARRLGPAALLCAVYGLALAVIGPTANVEVSDLYLYRSMTGLVQDGLIPYLDWGLEYPPLAIVPIALGGAFGNTEEIYPITFGLLMLGCFLAIQAWVGALAGRAAMWAVAVSPLLLGAMVRTHMDAFVVAMVTGALLLFARQRSTWAFAVLGLGTVTKLFPILLVPIAVVWLAARGERARILPGLAAFAAVVVVVCAPFLSDGFFDQFRFHLERPVQIESTPGLVLSAIGDSYVTGTEAHPDEFKSNGLAGGPADLVGNLFTVLLAVLWLATRGGDIRRLTYLWFAAILGFVVLGQVLSPQYLVWLLPFAAAAWAWGDRDLALLTAAASVLTLIEFPSRYFDVVAQETFAVVLVAARNAVLLVLLSLVVARLAGRGRSPTPSSAPRT
jgi:hypothetical protein